jgi:hypothetical protein
MFGFSKGSTKFETIQQSEDCESLPESQDNESNEKLRPREPLSGFYILLVVLITFIASLTLGIWTGRNLVLNRDKFCMKRISQPCKFLLPQVTTKSLTI